MIFETLLAKRLKIKPKIVHNVFQLGCGLEIGGEILTSAALEV